MLSVETVEPVRVVIDDTSFDFRELEPRSIEDHLDDFNETVGILRQGGVVPRKPLYLEEFACTDEHELFEYLMSDPGKLIDRDTKYRFLNIVGKCPEWDASVPAEADVCIADDNQVTALSVAFALTSALTGRGVACLVFGACARRGFLSVRNTTGEAHVFFFATAANLTEFWRYLYELENVPEAAFFSLATRAFPDLIFHPDLSFRRFEGGYGNLLQVVTHLSVLNDNFLSAYRVCKGLPRDVEMVLGAAGCPGISPESPRTHNDEKKMRQRDVIYEGDIIRCEWHSKLEPHRNRIHFSFGDRFGDRVFVGIFVDHLDT